MPTSSAPVPTLKVLVVDDNADMRLYLCGCLRNLGATHIVEAADGLEALHLARAFPVDLIISNVKMPGLNGTGLCRALEADAVLATIPVLLIGGKVTEQPTNAAVFLAKPFNAAKLRQQVEHLLALPRQKEATTQNDTFPLN